MHSSFSSSTLSRFDKYPAVSPIIVENIARKIIYSGDIKFDFMNSGLSLESLASIIIALPAEKLGDFQFKYIGENIEARFGSNLRGRKFSDLLNEYPMLLQCLQDYQTAHQTGLSKYARQRQDFSGKWIIEYTRLIVPLKSTPKGCVLIAGYQFHETNFDGLYF
ncbi:hypothetical protein MCEMSEM23_02153 [Rhabdaerophilaceae bacterium]